MRLKKTQNLNLKANQYILKGRSQNVGLPDKTHYTVYYTVDFF